MGKPGRDFIPLPQCAGPGVPLGGQRDEQGSITLGWEQGVWGIRGSGMVGKELGVCRRLLDHLLLGNPKPTAQPFASKANP